MSYAETARTQAKRLFTRAAKSPRLRKQLTVLANKWVARSMETDAQREERTDREIREYQENFAVKEAKRAALASRKAAAATRAEIWAARQAARYAGETPEQRAERFAAETRQWHERKDRKAERKAIRGARPVKRKKKGYKPKEQRWAERAERWRLREAAQEAKRVAKRKSRELPPLPYGLAARPKLPPLPY